MEIKVLDIESQLLGRKVIKLDDWEDVNEIIQEEANILKEFHPGYLYCQVEATDLTSIHLLETVGYRFSEFRIHCMLHTEDADVTTRSFFPFRAELIGNEEQLDQIISMLEALHQDDRFTNDPLIGKAFSVDRNNANLIKSFDSYPDEFLLGIFNSQTEELVAFRSGGFLSNLEAHFYQYGISDRHEFDQMSNMMENFTIEFLKQRGVKMIHAVSTGYNIAELNRLIKNHDFRIVSSHILLRKIFMG